MEIGHERADVPAVLGLHAVGEIALESAHRDLHRLVPPTEVALVHAVVGADPRSDDPRVRQQELADRRIECEAVDTLPRRVDQHRARPVHHVARRDLLASGLKHVCRGAAPLHADSPVDAEDGPNRGIDVDVGRAVEGIEQHRILAHAVLCRNRDDVLVFLRSHHTHSARVVETILDRLVREHVKLLLNLTLDVSCTVGAEDVHEPRATDGGRDDLGRQRDVVQQIRELTRRLGEAVLLIENEALDGRDGRLHTVPRKMRNRLGDLDTQRTSYTATRSRDCTAIRAPSVVMVTVPSRSVRSTSDTPFDSRASVTADGCP